MSADIGYGRTRSEVLSIVEQLLARKGVERAVSNGWWNKFLGRHPLLRTRTPATLSMSRAKASSRECIDAYFDRLEVCAQRIKRCPTCKVYTLCLKCVLILCC